jgi:hypothetical protein
MTTLVKPAVGGTAIDVDVFLKQPNRIRADALSEEGW